jgi:hypothetical protein
MLCLGVVTVLSERRRLTRALGIVVVGVTTALFVLRVPLGIPTLQRLGLTMSPFVAFLVGIGLYRLLAPANRRMSRVIPTFMIFILLTSSAHMVAGNDMYGLHAGPDLWERQTLPEDQQEFTVGEYQGLEQAADAARRHDAYLTTDWLSRLTLERFGTTAPGRMSLAGGNISIDEGLLLYRSRWGARSIELIPEIRVYQTLVIDPQWFHRMEQRESKVYTTGEVNLLWDNPEAPYLQTSQSAESS